MAILFLVLVLAFPWTFPWTIALDHDIFNSGDIDMSDSLINELDPDVGKSMIEIVESRGYAIESHYVTTTDGYILTMFHLVMQQTTEQLPPVLLQHGLLDSSYTWVSNMKSQSLGYILADSGFDVWFGNNRGNKYGRNHTSLNPDENLTFWDFTWDQMALHDVPAMVNHVLNSTGSPSISWIGHSQGTAQLFAAASMGSSMGVGHALQRTVLQRAIGGINLFIALAPVAYVHNLSSNLLKVLGGRDLTYNLYKSGIHEFLSGEGVDILAPELCSVYARGCEVVLDSICGPSTSLNSSRMQVYFSQTPAGTSTLNLLHWIQGLISPTFQHFDHGPEANIARYGQVTPPSYDLSKISIPTALFYGGQDALATEDDVKRIREEMNPERIIHVQLQPLYAHMDFTWAMNAHDEVYRDVVRLLQEFNPRQNV